MSDNDTYDQAFNNQDFSIEKLLPGEYENCQFNSCTFAKADLRNIKFTGCSFIECDFTMANVYETGSVLFFFRSRQKIVI